MLVLARKVGQHVTVDVPSSEHDKRVVIKVIEVTGSIVRLGIEADSSVEVRRVEDPSDG